MGRGGKREIQSTDSLKFLGFYFDTRPSPVAHVEQIKRKFRSRAWIIRKLKKPCVQSEDLVSLYGVLIRPVLNYVSSAYHTMLTADQTNEIERLQRNTLKTFFGLKLRYRKALEEAVIVLLH